MKKSKFRQVSLHSFVNMDINRAIDDSMIQRKQSIQARNLGMDSIKLEEKRNRSLDSEKDPKNDFYRNKSQLRLKQNQSKFSSLQKRNTSVPRNLSQQRYITQSKVVSVNSFQNSINFKSDDRLPILPKMKTQRNNHGVMSTQRTSALSLLQTITPGRSAHILQNGLETNIMKSEQKLKIKGLNKFDQFEEFKKKHKLNDDLKKIKKQIPLFQRAETINKEEDENLITTMTNMKINEFTSQTCFFDQKTLKPQNIRRQSILDRHLNIINHRNDYQIGSENSFSKLMKKSSKILTQETNIENKKIPLRKKPTKQFVKSPQKQNVNFASSDSDDASDYTSFAEASSFQSQSRDHFNYEPGNRNSNSSGKYNIQIYKAGINSEGNQKLPDRTIETLQNFEQNLQNKHKIQAQKQEEHNKTMKAIKYNQKALKKLTTRNTKTLSRAASKKLEEDRKKQFQWLTQSDVNFFKSIKTQFVKHKDPNTDDQPASPSESHATSTDESQDIIEIEEQAKKLITMVKHKNQNMTFADLKYVIGIQEEGYKSYTKSESDKYSETGDEPLQQNLGDINQLMTKTRDRDYTLDQLEARIAQTTFKDKDAFKPVSFDVKKAVIQKLDNAVQERELLDQGITNQSRKEQLICGTNDRDIIKTKKHMLNNIYFQEFYSRYQKNIENSLVQLDNQAKNDCQRIANYYLCQEDYQPQIKKFMSSKNIYRKDESKFEAKIEKDKLSGIIDKIDPKFQKMLMPTKLEDMVKEQQLKESTKKKIQEDKDKWIQAQLQHSKSIPSIVVTRDIGESQLQQFLNNRPNKNEYNENKCPVLKLNMKSVNQIKKQNYGKWYIKPKNFAKKNKDFDQQLNSIKVYDKK